MTTALALATTTTFLNKVYCGDTMTLARSLPSESVHCIVTSPPYYGLRDYGMDGQLGLETIPTEYVTNMVGLFREYRRVLRDDGTLWLNLGDSYANDGKWGGSTGGKHAHKNLIGIPWRVALALQDDGWILRQEIIWSKPAPMPESVKDRCTKSHEHIFLLTKNPRYYFDSDAIREPSVGNDGRAPSGSRGVLGNPNAGLRDGRKPRMIQYRNKRSVWEVHTEGFGGAHFATFPPKLIEPMILAGCPAGGIVLDPFMGSGTTAYVASKHGRNFMGAELNPDYHELIAERLATLDMPLFGDSSNRLSFLGEHDVA